jgi:hypothetical protein
MKIGPLFIPEFDINGSGLHAAKCLPVHKFKSDPVWLLPTPFRVRINTLLLPRMQPTSMKEFAFQCHAWRRFEI